MTSLPARRLGGEDLTSTCCALVNKRLVQLGLLKLERRPEEELEAARRRVIEWKSSTAPNPARCGTSMIVCRIFPRAQIFWTSEVIAEHLREKMVLAADACDKLLQKARSKAVSGCCSSADRAVFPAFRSLLEDRFPDLTILKWERRLTAVAEGAAWFSASRMALTDATAH
ncbi:MAG: hypothetical protein R3F31_03395 [Verrucomicrobiales bacterium]